MVALKEDKYRQLKKEIEREISHLKVLYSKIDKYEKAQQEGKKRKPDEYRIKKIETELKKKFPDMEFNRDLLKLVGALPYRNPASKDKELIAKAIAEKYE
jgi:translation initiation factor IF-2